MVEFSHLYMTTGKAIDLTIWTFVRKATSLLFNTLLRLIIAFLLRSKHLLTPWLLSSCAVILEPKKIWQCQKNVQTTTQLYLFHMLAKWNELKISQSCPTLVTPWIVHGVFQARILEWVAISFSRCKDQTCVSWISRQILYHWTTWEALALIIS